MRQRLERRARLKALAAARSANSLAGDQQPAAVLIVALQRVFSRRPGSVELPPADSLRLPLACFLAVWWAMVILLIFAVPTITWFTWFVFAFWLSPLYCWF